MSEPRPILAMSIPHLTEVKWEAMCMTSQKMYFLPATQIYWGKSTHYNTEPFLVKISKDYYQECMGTHADKKHINSNIRRDYKRMCVESCGYSKDEIKEWTDETFKESENYNYFELSAITKEDIVFKITKPEVVTNLPRKGNFIKFATAGIMSCDTSHMIPLYIYLYLHGGKPSDKTNKCGLLLTTFQMKSLFGYEYIFSYCSKPKSLEKWEIDFVNKYLAIKADESPVESQRLADLIKEYNILSSMINDKTYPDCVTYDDLAKDFFYQTIKKVSFKRWKFEHAVFSPALEALNKSGMMKIYPQICRKRSAKRLKAEKEVKLFSKIYRVIDEKSNFVDFRHIGYYFIAFERLL